MYGANDLPVKSSNFELCYPQLYSILLKDSTLRYLSLGPNGYYFARFDSNTNWRLSSSLESIANIHADYHKIDQFALGMNGAYVISRKDLSCSWDLRGHYVPLRESFDKEKGKCLNIKVRYMSEYSCKP